MNPLKFLLSLVLISVTLDFICVTVSYAHNWQKDLYEDELIICVKDTVKHTQDLTCHIYTDINGNEFQKLRDNGSLFSFNDSFKMDLID